MREALPGIIDTSSLLPPPSSLMMLPPSSETTARPACALGMAMGLYLHVMRMILGGRGCGGGGFAVDNAERPRRVNKETNA